MTEKARIFAVTGAASGIGAAAAHLVKERGGSVVALDLNRPDHDAFDRFIPFDQSDFAAADCAADELPDGIDGLLNIAGAPPARRFTPLKVLMTNFFGLRYFTERAAEKLKTGGAIVNMSSMAGDKWPENIDTLKQFLTASSDNEVAALVHEHRIGNEGLGHDAAYPLSKELVSLWTIQSSSAWRDKGLRINAVTCAAVETPILDDFLESFGAESAERIKSIGVAAPEHIARALVFLASTESVWLNGAVIPVDGGATAARIAKTYGL
ncbi:MAG: SDR family oxidoreductase [Parvularculaceae bacterium]